MSLMVKDLMEDLERGNRGEEIIKERSKNPFVPVNQYINPFMGVTMGTGMAQPIQWGTFSLGATSSPYPQSGQLQLGNIIGSAF